jgi:hypothetical protein
MAAMTMGLHLFESSVAYIFNLAVLLGFLKGSHNELTNELHHQILKLRPSFFKITRDVIIIDLNLIMLVISEGLEINDLFHPKP